MSLTPLNRSLHIYLFRFVDSYLSIFLVIVPWSNTSAGVVVAAAMVAVDLGREATLCRLAPTPRVSPPPPLASAHLSRRRRHERRICLETYETILSFLSG